MKISFEGKLLSLIILVGIILRCYHLYDMPFMHDEFSALFRTRYDSFSEVITNGVILGDTHPPGLQVFLWLYVQLVGENELLLKVPFVLMGVFSIPLIYKIGKEWFNKNVGLIAAVFIASSQYTLTYSVIIRPYISGLFLGLLMVIYWTKLVKGKSKFKNYIGFVFFAVLSAYNHHFGLLFSAVVGLTGLFVIHKTQLLKYVLSGVVILLLYLPNLTVFLSQLNQGGLDGWLSAPTIYFPINYVQYIFHFTIWNYLLALFVIFIGLLYSWTKRLTIFYKVSFLWFSMPLIIGFSYSVFVSPVIQYSMLLFTFPYFLFLLFGLYPSNISKRLTGTVVLLLLFVNVASLVVNRKHYQLLYQTRHLQFLKEINNLPQKEEAAILIANHPRINDYYQEKYKWDFPYVNYLYNVVGELGLKKVQEIIKESDQSFFVYGGVSYAKTEIIQLIKEKYPYCILKKDFYASHLYVFSKEDSVDLLAPYFLATNQFNVPQKGWSNSGSSFIEEDGVLASNSEWGPSYSVLLDSVLKHRNDVLTVKLSYEPLSSNKELFIVTELKHKDSVWSYAITSSNDYLIEGKAIYKTIELSGIRLPKSGLLFTTYVWNKNKGKFHLKEYEIQLRRGNPIQYSLYEPILEDYE